MADDSADEGVLDPLVTAHFEANPFHAQTIPLQDMTPEILALARGPEMEPSTRPIATVTDDVVDGVPIRIYRHDTPPTGVVVYFHGGGYCIGSIGLMDNVAREIAHAAHATVVSVGYRLAPEDPYPAGLDDCEAITRWALAHATDLGGVPARVAVAGESAGGNLSAAVTLRLRGSGEVPLAGQVLMYPGTDADSWDHASRREFDGIVLNRSVMEGYWQAYSGGRDLARDQYAAPLQADSLADLPPALVILGGCDLLRDEGRAYARRLAESDVPVDEICYAGQPHGFVNFGLPAADEAFTLMGTWLVDAFERAGGAP
ncbi:MAG TPA: alpha/beta hydrolase [Acidimicrobiia bacterium]|nr:alpha/beta hydrolase [Acidimicrobiia bacterium]